MKSVLVLLSSFTLAAASLAQGINSSWRQFETELVLVTSTAPDFINGLDSESLNILGANTAEEREKRAAFLAERNATLMSAPKILSVDGFPATMSVGETVGFFQPADDGHFEPKSTFIGVTFNFTIYAQSNSSIVLDSELRLSSMEGRTKLSATPLDVGPPILRLQKFNSQPTCSLGKWAVLGAGKIKGRDGSNQQVEAQLFAFVRVTENPVSDEEKERIRARYEAIGKQQGGGQ